MLVRHNTSLLEKAVELAMLRATMPSQRALADAAATQAKAKAQLRLATAVAFALASIGIGLGIFLASRRNSNDLAQSKASTTPPRSSYTEGQSPATLNFTKFTNRSFDFQGRSWDISAGHQFDRDTDINWKSAWCYAVISVDGVRVQVQLADRPNPSTSPFAPIASPETLARAGLSDASAVALAANCVWLDQKIFRGADFLIPPNRKPLNMVTPTSGNSTVPQTHHQPQRSVT